MKNLIIKSCFGIIAICLCIAVCYHPATASNHDHHFKTESVLKASNAVNSVFTVADVVFYSPADLPVSERAVKLYEAKNFSFVKDAVKPDNTLYQLIRAKQLKLHIATDSKAC